MTVSSVRVSPSTDTEQVPSATSSGELNTTLFACAVRVNDASSPSPSKLITVPEGALAPSPTERVFWVGLAGTWGILPPVAANRVPPVMSNCPSASSAPSSAPELHTKIVPPLIMREPFTSTPSPPEVTEILPPEMVNVWSPDAPKASALPPKPRKPLPSAPPAAFRPSSLATTVISPPVTVRSEPSRPS